MTSEEADATMPGDDVLLGALCEQARILLATLTGPVRRVCLQAGGHKVVIEWEPTAAPAGSHHGPPPVPVHPHPVEGGAAARDGLVGVTAPLVGTFYSAPEPGAEAFVAVGQLVEAEQEVGIIEAMKIMNRIVAPVTGRVADVIVADGEMVEFGQTIMYIDPDDVDVAS